jgi:hypothetical protein
MIIYYIALLGEIGAGSYIRELICNVGRQRAGIESLKEHVKTNPRSRNFF